MNMINPNAGKISAAMLGNENWITWEGGFDPTAFHYVRECIIGSDDRRSGRPVWPRPREVVTVGKPATNTPAEFKRLVGWSNLRSECERELQSDGSKLYFRRAFYLCSQDPRDGDDAYRSGFLPIGQTDAGEFPADAVDARTLVPGKLGTRPTTKT